MKIIEGGVTAAKGFEAASTAAKIKYQDITDMAMIYSQVPCECAGTFTTNVVKAACVKWDQQVVKSGAKAQAVIVNSGIANACTGAEGFGYCKDTADAAAEALGINADGVLIGSTGDRGCRKDRYHRWYGKRIWYDSSEYVHHAQLYHDRCSNHKRGTSESPQ